MTATRYYELSCNHETCTATFSASEDRADVTRSRAAAVGWVYGVRPPNPNRGGLAASLDYCPTHAEDLGDPRPKTLPGHARPA